MDEENIPPRVVTLESLADPLQTLTTNCTTLSLQTLTSNHASLTSTVKDNHASLLDQLDTISINAAHHTDISQQNSDNLRHILYPLHDNSEDDLGYLAQSVIDSNNYEVLSTDKKAVFTLIRLCKGGRFL